MTDFWIKQNDTAPSLQAILKDGDGNAVDLTGATVEFHMSSVDRTTKTVSQSANIVDAVAGKVQYDWQAGDTDTPGTFLAEWQVTYSNGTTETFPANGFFEITIGSELG